MLTFTTHNNHHDAIGTYGTCYTIVEDRDDAPVLYYINGINVEFDTLDEAIAYCEALEAVEIATHKCYALGVKAFGNWTESNQAVDFLHNAIDELAYVYCPSKESVQAFMELTEKCVDAYYLTHGTMLTSLHYSDAIIFKYDAHSDSFVPVSSDICNIVSQLVQ